MRTIYKVVSIVIVLAILLLSGFLFYKLYWKEQFVEKSQTVGEVTVNRDSDKIKITKINDPFWDTKTISSVIGKAYKIDQLENDKQPVHVEFAYDPKEIPTKISETDLRLFKWHDENEKKYWTMIDSQVDVERHIVSADLNSFSILAIKAPVTSYLSSSEIDEINKKLEEMEKNPPPFTCGLIMIMEEELITDEIQYSRTGDENIIEMHDCRNNGSVKSVNASFHINKEDQNGKPVTYITDALVEWQIDPAESITIEGSVKDQNGKPAENANVIAQKTKYDSWEKKITTDKNGHYSLKVHSGEYSLQAISKDSSCSEVTLKDEYCYKGNLRDDPVTQDYWQKDLELECSDFEIQAAGPVELYSPSLDPEVYYLLVGQSTEYSISSQQLSRIDDGYGWEGNWEINSNVKDEVTIKDNIETVPEGTMTTTDTYIRYGGIYSFSFTIPKKPKIGSIIYLDGDLSSGGYYVIDVAPGTVTIGGVSFNIYGDTGQEEPLQEMNLKCQFTQADETGATLQCDPVKDFMEKEGVILEIRRK